MAHYSKDPIMLNSFRNDEDIHKRTAAEIFGVEIDDVDGQMRRRAKTINFGLLYGMSAFGLSNQLEVSRAEADVFLNNYFERYSAVKSFMSKIVEEAKKDKFVKTLYNRKIHVPNIEAGNYMMRQGSERAAINGPLQGSAADIIKIAMIKIQDLINNDKSDIKMILQVHDELIFEVKKGFADEALENIKSLMESSIKLDIPLIVDANTGANWNEAH